MSEAGREKNRAGGRLRLSLDAWAVLLALAAAALVRLNVISRVSW